MTHLAFRPQALLKVKKQICPALGLGIPKRVKRLVQLYFEHNGLLLTARGYSVPFLFLRASLDVYNLLR